MSHEDARLGAGYWIVYYAARGLVAAAIIYWVWDLLHGVGTGFTGLVSGLLNK